MGDRRVNVQLFPQASDPHAATGFDALQAIRDDLNIVVGPGHSFLTAAAMVSLPPVIPYRMPSQTITPWVKQ